ncbi:DUF952 domain-containing protein [Curvivirga aplysinae]|uniref:DUF952 domain-containing protein n=1 Tax=Curvivirga aplysinae TaxID=2529852 RepID=UPI0012BC1255|nr:DUF952 domain-containing protein [Curvivirga aplysinae]MTI10266.1 DUF952 domain-containing protein [Curvivirga aplysinae]
MATIYHLADKSCWIKQAEEGVYAGREEDLSDGFLHFSNKEQIIKSAAVHKAGNPDLVLLAVDEGMLGDELKWEESRGGSLFPHLYGELPLEAVIWATPLALDDQGLHVFPEMED